MVFVGREFSPVVAVQQVVGGGQRHLTPQALVQRRLYLAHNEYATGSGALQERCQKLTLFLQAHVLAFAPARGRRIWRAYFVSMNKAAAQLTGPTP